MRAEAAVLVGGGDLDEAEIAALERHPILHVEMSTLMKPDVAERVQAALHERATEAQSWCLHLDQDVGGPELSPGGLTPAHFWPPREHLLAAVRATTRTLPVKVASLAVYNPSADVDGRGAQFGLEMAAAAIDGMAGA